MREIIVVVTHDVVNFGNGLRVCVETVKCFSGCGRPVLFSFDVLTFCILGYVGPLHDKYRCLFPPMFGPACGRADE